jgi:hypothetical protein
MAAPSISNMGAMTFLAKLFKNEPVIAAEDPVFGHITFERGIGVQIPNPPTAAFMITVDAQESGPRLQQDFFQMIRGRLSEFEQCARDFMRSRVEPSVDVSQLSAYSIEIGSEGETRQHRFVLEMSDEQADIVHRVSFMGDAPVGYGCDC